MIASDPFIAIGFFFFKVLLQLLIRSTFTDLYVFEQAPQNGSCLNRGY